MNRNYNKGAIMNQLSLTTKEVKTIHQIAKRASWMAKDLGFYATLDDLYLDILNCHTSDCKLDLQKFLTFNDYNLAHDAFGIQRHINRTTGELKDCFLPRCAK